MTKLKAWQEWCSQNSASIIGTEYSLTHTSHGRAFSFSWDTATRELCTIAFKAINAMTPDDAAEAVRELRALVAEMKGES
jgi:hypothetical protein